MLKKLALIVVLGISNLHAADVPKTSLIKRIKNSPVTLKIVAGIIPCIAAMISMEVVGRVYKNRPDKKKVVIAAHYIKCISLGVFTVFYDWIVKFHIKKRLSHLKNKNKKNKEPEAIQSGSSMVPI